MALMSNTNWSHVYVERFVNDGDDDGPGRIDDCLSRPGQAECLDLYRVEWVETRTCDKGRRLQYHFRAPDAESVRQVFRKTRTEFDALWTSMSDTA